MKMIIYVDGTTVEWDGELYEPFPEPEDCSDEDEEDLA